MNSANWFLSITDEWIKLEGWNSINCFPGIWLFSHFINTYAKLRVSPHSPNYLYRKAIWCGMRMKHKLELSRSIKVQELGRYTVNPSSPEDGGLWLDPLWKMSHRQVPWAGLLLSGPWRVLCNWSGFGFPPHKGNTISQHYLASLMSIWSDKL